MFYMWITVVFRNMYSLTKSMLQTRGAMNTWISPSWLEGTCVIMWRIAVRWGAMHSWIYFFHHELHYITLWWIWEITGGPLTLTKLHWKLYMHKLSCIYIFVRSVVAMCYVRYECTLLDSNRTHWTATDHAETRWQSLTITIWTYHWAAGTSAMQICIYRHCCSARCHVRHPLPTICSNIWWYHQTFITVIYSIYIYITWPHAYTFVHSITLPQSHCYIDWVLHLALKINDVEWVDTIVGNTIHGYCCALSLLVHSLTSFESQYVWFYIQCCFLMYNTSSCIDSYKYI
jgi:hypothetical protein